MLPYHMSPRQPAEHMLPGTIAERKAGSKGDFRPAGNDLLQLVQAALGEEEGGGCTTGIDCMAHPADTTSQHRPGRCAGAAQLRYDYCKREGPMRTQNSERKSHSTQQERFTFGSSTDTDWIGLGLTRQADKT
ncbi:unnamed protein product [Polarella glacialis]|uniref:Uncharacterized protein n=1 Tax=Polarella glacialis TaxID=89957 RepID=A0A813JNK1_POLGL|nr:unnamed protein product [Polarella glacialis]CAE8680582.1 unnamed protein product [Polarella glacialis]